MAGQKRQRRRAEIIVPEVRQAAAPTVQQTDSRYHRERFSDGSERPVRNMRRANREREQAFADFFGVSAVLAPQANIRTMDSILVEIAGLLHLSETDIAPEMLAAAWQKAVGPFLSSQSELVSIVRGTATIRTMHPAVRYELQRLKAQIIRVVNAVLGEGSVRSVRIVHG